MDSLLLAWSLSENIHPYQPLSSRVSHHTEKPTPSPSFSLLYGTLKRNKKRQFLPSISSFSHQNRYHLSINYRIRKQNGLIILHIYIICIGHIETTAAYQKLTVFTFILVKIKFHCVAATVMFAIFFLSLHTIIFTTWTSSVSLLVSRSLNW